MYEQMNKQLAQYRQDISRLRKIDAMINTLENERRFLKDKSWSDKNRLDKESRDYEKITEVSLSSIFYNVLGKLDERTEKERQEVLEAELKYNQTLQDLEDIQKQISALLSEKSLYINAEAAYDRLYKEKFQLLMNADSRTAQEIMELNRRAEQSMCNLREIDEAINIGYETEESLAAALKSLESAEGWGMWDMLGGGFLSDMVKHSHLDDAGSAAQHAQNLLRRFRTELADVRISEEIQMDISGFARFADFFFDGLLADWFMQSKINATQKSIQSVRGQVNNVINKLQELRDAELKTRTSLNEQVSRMVVNA